MKPLKNTEANHMSEFQFAGLQLRERLDRSRRDLGIDWLLHFLFSRFRLHIRRTSESG